MSGNKLDKRVGGFLDKVSKGMEAKNKSIVYEQAEHQEGVMVSEETMVLLEEIDKLHRLVLNLRREMKSTIREELDNIIGNATLITEGKGDEVYIKLGGHHFKGTVKIAKK